MVTWKRPLNSFPVREVSPKTLSPLYGLALSGKRMRGRGVVRSDLPPGVKQHVILHEQVHLKYGKGEIFTNVVSLIHDPAGWFKTAFYTIKDPLRRRHYISNIKHFFRRK